MAKVTDGLDRDLINLRVWVDAKYLCDLRRRDARLREEIVRQAADKLPRLHGSDDAAGLRFRVGLVVNELTDPDAAIVACDECVFLRRLAWTFNGPGQRVGIGHNFRGLIFAEEYNRTVDSITKTAEIVAEGEHLIGSFGAESEGPTLMVFGGIHGNETAGVRAARRVAEKLAALEVRLHGRIFLFAGNTRALQKGVRFIHQDLNRHWTDANVTRNDPGSNLPPQFSEDREQMELLAAIMPVLKSARNEVYALDLHSTSAEGVPFATVGDTIRNRSFATKLPVTILLGIEEQLEGTLLEYMNNIGAVTMGFEGGQHYAESTVNTHESLVWLAAEAAGVINRSDIPDADYHAQVVKNATGKQEILEVRYRHAIGEEDGFSMHPGYENFQPIEKGEHLADDRTGAVRAPERGVILMPLYQKLGEDGFFIGRRVSPFWLWVSAILRRLRVADLIHFLPGVHPTDRGREVLQVDTKVARFFPLQVFHLLGFRKLRWTGESLIVSRRKHDIRSPFTKEG